MLSEEEKTIIIQLAKHYHAQRVLLFGSSSNPSLQGKDIDLAVEGIPPHEFFRFYGELLFNLSKPVDLIDLTIDNKFTRLVKRDGVPLYG